MKILNNFELPLWLNCNQMDIKVVISIKYCLGKNQTSETFCSKFIRCQSLLQLQYLKILSTLSWHKNPRGQNFWSLKFFYLKRQGYRYYQEKNQVGLTSSSYINLAMKLLIKLYLWAQKQSKSEILAFFRKLYLTFSLA